MNWPHSCANLTIKLPSPKSNWSTWWVPRKKRHLKFHTKTFSIKSTDQWLWKCWWPGSQHALFTMGSSCFCLRFLRETMPLLTIRSTLHLSL
jgi:hypothetical protein